MILLRAAFTKLFPHLDRILSLDCDTIVNDNISDLWDIPLDDYYIAGVKEPKKSRGRKIYINTGVLLFNLKKLREDGKDDEAIHDLNTYYRFYPEQDCFNDLFSGKILELPSDYNVNNYSHSNCKSLKIIHFAAIKNWSKMPMVEKYRDADIIRNQVHNIDLDIIIPYYNNPTGLEITLKSVVYPDIPNIHITVVDDCSTEPYDDIKELYPTVNFLKVEKNGGPGVARQYGIDNTNGTYIMFIDTADYLLSKYSLLEVLCTINNNSVPYMYLWRWLNAEHGTYSSDWNPLLHGWVIKREFLDLYNIRFSVEGSRSNEDFGFIQSCKLMLAQIGLKDKTKYFQFNETPIYMYTYDADSITHADNKLYMYTTHIKGLTINAKHLYDFCIKHKIDKNLMVPIFCDVTWRLYRDFLSCAMDKPEYLKDNWKHIKDYYINVYKPLEKISKVYMDHLYSQRMSSLVKLRTSLPINLNRFLAELDKYNEMPE